MQHLVEEIYRGDFSDVGKTVSRYEFEMRDTRNKIDIGELYIELNLMKTALENAGIQLPQEPTAKREDNLVDILQEDRRNMEEWLAEELHIQHMMAKEKKGLLARFKRWGIRNVHMRSNLDENIQLLLSKKEGPDLMKEILESVPEKTSPTHP